MSQSDFRSKPISYLFQQISREASKIIIYVLKSMGGGGEVEK